MTTASGRSEHKISVLCRYWRTDLSNLFRQNMSAFFEDLPAKLLSESESQPAHHQQDYLDLIIMLQHDKSNVKSAAGVSINACIEEFANQGKLAASKGSGSNKLLSLIDTEDIEVTVVIEGLAARISSPIHEILYDAFLRINQLIPSISKENQLPCHPRAFLQSMLETFTALPLSSAQKIILAKLFAQFINIEDLGAVIQSSLQGANIAKYEQAIKNLDHGKAAPKKKRSIEELVHDLSSMSLKAVGQNAVNNQSSTNLKTLDSDGQPANTNSGLYTQSKESPSSAEPLIEQLGSLRKLREQMSNMPITPAAKNPMVAEQQVQTTELNSLLEQIQHEEPVKSVREDTSIQTVGEVRNKIRGQLKSNDTLVQTLNDKDTDTINLVSLMFDYILDNPNLPTTMKALLARLQIPILRVALLSPEFFSKSHHPARKLLDTLSKAGISWDKAGNKDSYYDKLEGIVFRILKEFQGDVTLFETLLEELEQFLEKQEENVKRVVDRTLTIENKRAQTILAKTQIQQHLNTRLVGKKLPLAVVKILQQGWWHVLYHTFVRHGESSEQWKNALKIVDALLWSITEPAENKNDWMKQVSAIRQKLMENLKKGLVQINYDEMERVKLMDEISLIHDKVLQNQNIEDLKVTITEQKASTKKQAKTADDADIPVAASQSELVQFGFEKPEAEDSSSEDAKLEMVGSHAVALPVKNDTSKEVDTDDEQLREYINLVNDITAGTWFEFNFEGAESKRYKLAAIIRSLNRMVFTNRRGIKVAEVSRLTLAKKLRKKQARILEEDDHLIESALKSVMTELES